MGAKSLAILAAACAASLAAPCLAQEVRAPTTMFFVEVPLGARTATEMTPNFGLELQGTRPYDAVRIDRRMFNLLPALAGVEGTWIVAGAVGVVAIAALTHKDKATTQQLNADKQQQLEACPTLCAPK